MRCPSCQSTSTRVVDSRLTEPGDAVRRRRECEQCSTRFTTYERAEARQVTVIKRDGSRQAFDRQKLLRGLPRPASWRSRRQKFRPTLEAVWVIPPRVSQGEARKQPHNQESRGEPMPHARSAADQSTPATPRIGTTGLKIERYFTEAGRQPFD